MKSFKRFFTENKSLSGDSVIDWCFDNIENFEEINKRPFGTEIVINDNIAIIKFYVNGITINTKEAVLPFRFFSALGYEIKAPNLKSFDFTAFTLTDDQMLTFKNDNMLDYSTLNYFDT